MENAFQENVYAMKTIREKIAANLLAIAIIEENVYLIKLVYAMKDSMEKTAKKAYAKIIAARMELAIKENVYVNPAGAAKPVILSFAPMIALVKENVKMENAFACLEAKEKIVLKAFVHLIAVIKEDA